MMNLSFTRVTKRRLFFAAAILLLVPNVLNIDLNNDSYNTPPFNGIEYYDPGLLRLNSMDKLEQYTDSLAGASGIYIGSLNYAILAEDVLKRRFYHGYSHFTLRENWIAAAGERLVGYALSCKVKPDDILMHPNAACSQQAMVMMELMARKGINYRKASFDHHYAMQAYIDSDWYYFDSNMEPLIGKVQRSNIYLQGQADRLKPFYDDSVRYKNLDYILGSHSLISNGPVNDRLAPNAKRFQDATTIASRTLWLFPFLGFLWYSQFFSLFTVSALQHVFRRRIRLWQLRLPVGAGE